MVEVDRGEYKVSTFPQDEEIDSTTTKGCTLVSVYYTHHRKKIGGIIHLGEGTNISIIDDCFKKMESMGVPKDKLRVDVFAKTLNREIYSKEENTLLEDVCKKLSQQPISIDRYSKITLYLKDGRVTKE